MSCYKALRFATAMLILLISGTLPAFAEARRIVLLYDERQDLPGLSKLDAGFVDTLTSNTKNTIEVYREAMDLSRLGSTSDYFLLLRNHLQAKYENKKIDVVVAVMGPSLDFLLNHGDFIFPKTPIVFCGIDRRELGSRRLPPHVTGILVKRQFAPTLELALTLHPGTKNIVFVGGTSEFDKLLVEQAQREFTAFEDRVHFRYLTTLPMPELLKELSHLPPGTIVLCSTVFQDGAGVPFVPHEVVRQVSQASNSPLYGFVDQFLGLGIVGGFLYSMGTQGMEAASLTEQILNGSNVSQLPLKESGAGEILFDWRQMQRWKINSSSLPPGATIRFRPQSFWDQYKRYAIAAIAVMALQLFMIGGLLVQRIRRRRVETQLHKSELEMQRHREELAHVTRVRMMGEFTVSVAHELKQPLGAILNNAGAAELFLNADPPPIHEVRKALTDISNDTMRSTEIIHKMRDLLEKHEIVRRPIDVNFVVEEIVRLMNAEAAIRKVRISFQPEQGLPKVNGDRVHLQQVVMNLVLNSFEAMASVIEHHRRVCIQTGSNHNGMVMISVSDSGPGIPEDRLSKLFEPFYTTKKEGLGMGLSISRTIMEAHEGRLWAENNRDSGATFRIELPIAND